MADKTEKKKGFFAGVKRFFGRIGKFFRDTVSEMKKVVWPLEKADHQQHRRGGCRGGRGRGTHHGPATLCSASG